MVVIREELPGTLIVSHGQKLGVGEVARHSAFIPEKG